MLKNYAPFGSVDIEIVTISVWLMHFLDLGYVPTSDAINGSIGEGVEEIPSMGRGKYLRIQGRYPQLIQNSVPVVVTFTKFDVVILIEGRNS